MTPAARDPGAARRTQRDWPIGLAIALALGALLFWPSLHGGRTLLQAGDLYRDPIWRSERPAGPLPAIGDLSGAIVDYPADWIAAQELRAGLLPLRNPSVGLGLPLLAEWHTAPLSLLKLPFDLAPSLRTYDLYLALRLVLAALGAFLVARRRRLGVGASALAAVAYGASGALVSRFSLPTEGAAHALLPFVVLSFAAAVESTDARGLVGAALALFVLVLAAHPDLVALALAGAIVAAVAGLAADPTRASRASLRPTLVRTGLVVLFGLAAAALQIVPFVADLLGGHSYKFHAHEARFFRGEPAHLRATLGVLLYLGVPGTLLALLGLQSPRARGARLYLALTATLFALLCLATFRLRPPYSDLIPARYAAFLVVLGLALLAGHGAERLAAREAGWMALAGSALGGLTLLAIGRKLTRDTLPDRTSLTRHGLVALAVLAIFAAAALPRGARLDRLRAALRRALPAFAAVVVASELLLFARPRLYPTPALRLTPPPAVAALQSILGPGDRLIGLGAEKLEDAALVPNLAGLFGLEDVRAVAAIFPSRYHELVAHLEGARAYPTVRLFERASSPLLPLLGVKAIIAPADGPAPALPLVYRDSGCRIYRSEALPRAFVVDRLYPVASSGAAFALLDEKGALFSAGNAAIVEGDVAPGLPTLASTETASSRPAPAAWSLRAPSNETLELDGSSDRPGLLVVTDLYDEAWHAEVDGRAARVLPVDGFALGVLLDAGPHHVELHYRPAAVLLGAIVSAMTFSFLIVLLARDRRKRRA